MYVSMPMGIERIVGNGSDRALLVFHLEGSTVLNT